MSKNKSKTVFKVGDRVAERPSPRTLFAATPSGRATVKKVIQQRYGTVIKLEIDTDARGHKHEYLTVQWEESRKISKHAKFRLCLADSLDKLAEEFNPV
jgi:hypothetical protein